MPPEAWQRSGIVELGIRHPLRILAEFVRPITLFDVLRSAGGNGAEEEVFREQMVVCTDTGGVLRGLRRF